MSRTVTALYDSLKEAEAARQRLAMTLDLGSARIIDHPDDLDRIAMSAEDRHAHAEGIRRGAYVLSAEVRGHEEADRIVRILEDSASLDLDRRQEEWQRDGWSSSPPPHLAGSPGFEAMAGTREAGRGGNRARSYLRDLPTEQRYGRQASPANRPSKAVVISSAVIGAVAGAIIGGALPFLLLEETPPRARGGNALGPDGSRNAGPRSVPVSSDGRVRIIRS